MAVATQPERAVTVPGLPAPPRLWWLTVPIGGRADRFLAAHRHARVSGFLERALNPGQQ